MSQLPSYAEECLVGEKQIQKRVNEIADQIVRDYTPIMVPGHPLVLICVLKGSYIFTADLARELERRGLYILVEFMCVSSYGKGSESTGEVRVLLDIRNPIRAHHTLIIEDIVDSARTMSFLRDLLQTRGPKSLKLVTLLDKPSRRVVKNVHVDYVGFTIPDKFVVGYGLDYAERYRNVPSVYALKKSVYSKEPHHSKL